MLVDNAREMRDYANMCSARVNMQGLMFLMLSTVYASGHHECFINYTWSLLGLKMIVII